MRYVSLDLPLKSIHPKAFNAAVAAECAGEQGQFWAMHKRLFANQRALEPWSGHAEAIGLDVEQFNVCMTSDEIIQGVQRDIGEATKAGATGTPSFVLGLTNAEDPSKVKGIAFLRGAQPFAAFKAEIDKALADLESGE